MTSAVSILPGPQLAALNAAYRKAVARKRLNVMLGGAVFCVALVIAGIGAEVNVRTLFTYFGNFISYFDRIFTLDTGARVWTDVGEWLWGWQKWLRMLGETILISYVGTLIGAVLAFGANFLAAENTSPAPWLRFVVRRLLEFARTVPGIVFALIFVIAFGLGPMAGVLAIAIHSTGALGKTERSVGARSFIAAKRRSSLLGWLWTKRPARQRNITAPIAKTSVRASMSYVLPRACSGGMYAAVPMTVPAAVAACPYAGSRRRARPKSRTLICPVFSEKRFAGLMSRWTTPLPCAAPSVSRA